VLDRKLWEASGHWENYRKNMFMATVEDQDEGHRMLAAQADELPLSRAGVQPRPALLPRAAAAHGRVRSLPPLRAVGRAARHHARARLHPGRRHIFCEEGQIADETVRFVALLSRIYRDLGFDELRVKFSDRPDTRAGDDATWDRSEGR
jgi:threonyl-tRNA synthetase